MSQTFVGALDDSPHVLQAPKRPQAARGNRHPTTHHSFIPIAITIVTIRIIVITALTLFIIIVFVLCLDPLLRRFLRFQRLVDWRSCS